MRNSKFEKDFMEKEKEERNGSERMMLINFNMFPLKM